MFARNEAEPDARPGVSAFLPFAALIAGGVAIGFSPIFVRLSEAGPTPTAFYRVLFALPFLLLIDRWATDAPAAAPDGMPARDVRLYALAGAFYAGDLMLWHWGLGLTSVANATLLANVAPIFVTLASWLLFRERVTLLFLAGLATSITGAAALVGQGASIGSGNLVGDAFAAGAAAAYGGYLMTVGHLRRRYSTSRLMLLATATSALFLLPASLVSGETLFPSTAGGWANLLGLALVSQVGGQSLIAYALRHVPLAFSSVTLLLQPVVATLLAWLLFSEVLGMLQMAGGMLVLAGILICRQATQRRAARPQP